MFRHLYHEHTCEHWVSWVASYFVVETYFDHAVKRVCRSTLAAATGRVFTCVGAGEYMRTCPGLDAGTLAP